MSQSNDQLINDRPTLIVVACLVGLASFFAWAIVLNV
jgi:hypothetical protein